MQRILVVGANGKLGRMLQSLAPQYAQHYVFTFLDSSALDIRNLEAVRAAVKGHKYVINCAAYTHVDRAESEREQAWAVNVTGVQWLAMSCDEQTAKLIHISTDYVFDGRSQVPYQESDATHPINYYGETKLAGEIAVLQYCTEGVVIRTSWLYAPYRDNFVKTILRLGREKSDINVVDDQIGSPTYAADLAEFVLQICAQWNQHNSLSPLYHYANSGRISWYEFAKEIIALSGLDCVVHPVPTSAYPTVAKRPKYSLLSTERAEREVNTEIRDWRESLKNCIELIKENEHGNN